VVSAPPGDGDARLGPRSRAPSPPLFFLGVLRSGSSFSASLSSAFLPLFCGGGAQVKGLEARVWLAARGFIGGARVSRGSRRHGRPANLGVRAGTRGGHPTARRWLGAGGKWSRARQKREHGLVGDVGRLQARPLLAFCRGVEAGCSAREARRGRRKQRQHREVGEK